jgi:hypothetical protein
MCSTCSLSQAGGLQSLRLLSTWRIACPVIARPCLGAGCGCSPPSGSRCPDCKLPDPPRAPHSTRRLRLALAQTIGPHTATQPFCEMPGCKSTDLTVDHRIPISEMPELAYEELQLPRVLCRSHSTTKGATVTDADKQAVLDAIAKRRARCNAYYRWKLGNGIGPL